MRIKNETRWRTDHLKALIGRVAKEELEPEQKKKLLVTVRYRKSNARTWGHATIGTPFHQVLRMRLLLPFPGREFDKPKHALIIAHEMAHCRGLRHREMKSSRYDWVEGWKERYAYAEQFPMELAPEMMAAKATDADKAERLIVKLKRWQAKKKRAETAIGKLKRRLRHYERKLQQAAMKTTEALS